MTRTAATPRAGHRPWWAGEHVVPLHEVPNLLPRRRTGRLVSIASVYRWSQIGVLGVRLRRFKAAGARGFATTREEIDRFLAALTALGGEDIA
jgi:hypothetical protein